MRRQIITALVCLNVVLVGAVLYGAIPEAREAQAQTIRGASDYLLLTGQMENDFDVVYVIDLASRRMVAWQFDRTAKRLVPIGVRDLTKDFRTR